MILGTSTPVQTRGSKCHWSRRVRVVRRVPGDIVHVRSGDLVPADRRLLEAEELEVNQATLTGEPVPQTKWVAAVTGGGPIDWKDIAFAGTDVVGGDGIGVVAVTGAGTEFGKTASLVKGAVDTLCIDKTGTITEIGGAFVVTVGLVNIPLTQGLLGFAGLRWKEQLLIELYAVLYVVVANILRRPFDRYSVSVTPQGGSGAASASRWQVLPETVVAATFCSPARWLELAHAGWNDLPSMGPSVAR
jgi:hypothetical protein